MTLNRIAFIFAVSDWSIYIDCVSYCTCRTFDDVDVHPGPHLNVIVGPNGKPVQCVDMCMHEQCLGIELGKGSFHVNVSTYEVYYVLYILHYVLV